VDSEFYIGRRKMGNSVSRIRLLILRGNAGSVSWQINAYSMMKSKKSGGELEEWWIPYLIWPQPKRAAQYEAIYSNTCAFLPPAAPRWNPNQHAPFRFACRHASYPVGVGICGRNESSERFCREYTFRRPAAGMSLIGVITLGRRSDCG
jgi:hypothetical protein